MENLMPYLKRFDSYLLFNEVVINKANIKDERMISILFNSKEIKLIDSKVSLSGLSDEPAKISSVKSIYLNKYNESVYFIQTLGKVEKLRVIDSTIMIDPSKEFAPKKFAKYV
jgi:hypothetical protein